MNLTPLIHQKVRELDRQLQAIARERKALKDLLRVLAPAEKIANGVSHNPGTTGFHLSAEARRKIGLAQKKRWAQIRAQKKV